MEKEIWKDIPGFEGRYQASNLGRIKSVGNKQTYKHERILKQTKGPGGYHRVHLSVDGAKCTRSVGRLVASAFIPNPENKPQVDHIDTNPENNYVNNLRWTTVKENANNLLTRIHKSKSKKGTKNPMYGIVQEELLKELWIKNSKAVCKCDEDFKVIESFKSITEAERITGINSKSISSICRNPQGVRQHAGGFRWKYLDEDK